MTKYLKKIINFLLYGGSFKLNKYENYLINLASNSLPIVEKEILEQQITCVQRVKRYNNGRMVTFQFDGSNNFKLFLNKEAEACLVTFKFNSKSVGALIIHCGKISSLELEISPDQLKLEELAASCWDVNPNIAYLIDKEEH